MVFYTARFGSDTSREKLTEIGFSCTSPSGMRNATIPGSDPARLGSETTQTHPPRTPSAATLAMAYSPSFPRRRSYKPSHHFVRTRGAVVIQRLHTQAPRNRLHGIFVVHSRLQRILPPRVDYPFAAIRICRNDRGRRCRCDRGFGSRPEGAAWLLCASFVFL